MAKYLSWETKMFAALRKNPFKYGLLITGIILVVFGSINYYRVRRLSFSKAPPITAASLENLDIPAEIMIPSLSLDLSVDPGIIMDGVWQVSPRNATFLTTSAAPDSVGNTVIYGHNYRKILGSLPYIKAGEKIIVKSKSGKIFTYIVDKTHLVDPDRVDLVSPTDKKELTIYTCTGFADSKRFVVKAYPVE